MSTQHNPNAPDGDLNLPDPLETPFDIALAPPNFELGPADSPGQEAALGSAFLAPGNIYDRGEGFSLLKPQNLPLRMLETWSEGNQTTHGIAALSGRKSISYKGGDYTVEADNGDIFWTMDNTYLDLLICVGGGLGLGTLLPNVAVLHHHEFRMDLQKPMRQFTAKYAKLGFDPTDSMLWIGRSGASEDVWLAFPPRSFLVESGEYDDRRGSHWRRQRSTTLPKYVYRRVVMFLSAMLCGIDYLDITVKTKYPDVTDDEAFKRATNLQ